LTTAPTLEGKFLSSLLYFRDHFALPRATQQHEYWRYETTFYRRAKSS